MQSERANKHPPPVISPRETTLQVFLVYTSCLANSAYFNNKFFDDDKVDSPKKNSKRNYHKDFKNLRQKYIVNLSMNFFLVESMRCKLISTFS